MSPTISLLNDRVLLRPEKAQATQENGLYVPETAASKVARGVVVAAYNDLLYRPGYVVLYVREEGIDVRIAGEDYVIVNHEHCHGIIRPEGP
jgi:co-chaperonin GroES (HSP10)